VFEQMFDAARVAVTSTPTSARVGPGVDGCEEARMRHDDDPVEVRRGETEDPDQFLWRGRLWKVRAVVAHWVETGLRAERETWRVEAGRGTPSDRQATHGVFDLSYDGTDGRWQLVGCQD
jgi:hypothetical protein